MDRSLAERLDAVENTLTETDAAETGIERRERLDGVESEIEELTDRVAELEAATQALRGYVGNVRSVNQEVEKRADLALSKAEDALDQSESSAAVSEPVNAATDGSARAATRRDRSGEEGFGTRTDEAVEAPIDEMPVDPADLFDETDAAEQRDSRASRLVGRIRGLL